MKKAFFIGTMLLCGIMMIATPADAQTRKEKKAAKKADWEFEQQVKQMERQRKLDSIANLANPANEVLLQNLAITYDLYLNNVEEAIKYYKLCMVAKNHRKDEDGIRRIQAHIARRSQH